MVGITNLELESNVKSLGAAQEDQKRESQQQNDELNKKFSQMDTRIKKSEQALSEVLTQLAGISASLKIISGQKRDEQLDAPTPDIITKEETKPTSLPPSALPTDTHEKSSDELPSAPKEQVNRKRNGRLDLRSGREDSQFLTQGEKFVIKAWPEAILPCDIDDDVFTSAKNRVTLRPEWRLITADAAVFHKLLQIQNALQTALVPYRLWPQRLTLEMGGDFHGVRV
ncbi:hypothetical protein K3495_g10352 [Podosphaera aphanis]|nr:hypothetical protein K3495_g10352 [Podosphaera aphanis]